MSVGQDQREYKRNKWATMSDAERARIYTMARLRWSKLSDADRKRPPEDKEKKRIRSAKYFECRNGFSPDLVAGMLEHQGDACAICRVSFGPDGQRPNGMMRDHCHVAGGPRGLLCRICNISLGQYEKHQRPAGLRIDVYDTYMARCCP